MSRSSPKRQLSCPNGVIESALSSCIKAVRLAPCGGGAAAMTTLAACRPQALCAP